MLMRQEDLSDHILFANAEYIYRNPAYKHTRPNWPDFHCIHTMIINRRIIGLLGGEWWRVHKR